MPARFGDHHAAVSLRRGLRHGAGCQIRPSARRKRLLVVALARARNTGMKLNESEDEIIERGAAPIL